MNSVERNMVETAIRSLRFQKRDAEDLCMSCWLHAGVYFAGGAMAIIVACLVAPVFWLAAIGLLGLFVHSAINGIEAARRSHRLRDQLDDEQLKLIMDRAPSADRYRS
jgi:hypothetical protein